MWLVFEVGLHGGDVSETSPRTHHAYHIPPLQGLPTEDLIVVSAEKQRNLSKKKGWDYRNLHATVYHTIPRVSIAPSTVILHSWLCLQYSIDGYNYRNPPLILIL